jgi:hypothetical protein
MFADPTLMPIEEKRIMGMWPPSKDNIADSLYPYVKRMKDEKVKILLVGDVMGENAVRFLELDNSNKIEYINLWKGELRYLPDHLAQFNDALNKNLKQYSEKIVFPDALQKKYNLVFVDSEELNTDNKDLQIAQLVDAYKRVEQGGIICGNNHHKDYVKLALSNFRRSEKIGTPIQVSNRLCWFWIKR